MLFDLFGAGNKAKKTAEQAETKSGKAGAVGGAVVGGAAGAVLGSVVPVVGTAVGMKVGAIAGGFVGAALGDDLEHDANRRAFEERAARNPPTPPAKRPVRRAPLVACAACGTKVRQDRTLFNEAGAVCEACFG